VDEQEQREWLKVPEVAEFLQIGRSRAYELVADGDIPAVKIGRSVRVSRKELDRWLEGQRYADIART
jgi:excisionase family DNA binding protein